MLTHLEAYKFPRLEIFDIPHVSVCKSYLSQGEISHKFMRYANDNKIRGCKSYWDFVNKTDLLDVEFIYKMLVSDALVGNEARHYNNWDVTEDVSESTVRYAPLIDFGASLLAKKTEKELDRILDSSSNKRVHAIKKYVNARKKYFEVLL